MYAFHTIYPTRQNWQMILAPTKIFNIFPGLVQASSIVKILSFFIADTNTIAYRTETFGSTDFTMTFQIHLKNSA